MQIELKNAREKERERKSERRGLTKKKKRGTRLKD